MHSVGLSGLCCSQTRLTKWGSSGDAHAQQNSEQQQQAPHVSGHEEIFFDVLATVPSQLCGELGVSEEIADLISASFDRMNQHAGQLVDDLVGMPPTAPAIVGFPFQSASVTVRPNPSLIDFWTTMVDARCSALISSAHHGGKSRMIMS